MKPRKILVNDKTYKWWIRKSKERYSSRFKVVILSPFGYEHIFSINEVTSDNMDWDIDNEFGGKITPSDIKKMIETKDLK